MWSQICTYMVYDYDQDIVLNIIDIMIYIICFMNTDIGLQSMHTFNVNVCRYMYTSSVCIYGFMVVLSHAHELHTGWISQSARPTLQQSNVQRKGSPADVRPLWNRSLQQNGDVTLALQTKCCKHHRCMSCSSTLQILNIWYMQL